MKWTARDPDGTLWEFNRKPQWKERRWRYTAEDEIGRGEYKCLELPRTITIPHPIRLLHFLFAPFSLRNKGHTRNHYGYADLRGKSFLQSDR